MSFELSTISITVLVLISLIAVFAAVFFYYYKRHIYHTKHIIPRIKDWVFLEIQMPKETSPDKDEQRPKTEEEKKGFDSRRGTAVHNPFRIRPQQRLAFG